MPSGHWDLTPEQRAEYQAAYGAKNRALIAEARARPCTDCGLVEPAIMDMDHVPERGPKLFSIGTSPEHRSVTGLIAELAKCDPVCPNCHRRRTNARQQVS